MSSRFSFRRIGAILGKEFIQMRRDRLTFAMILGIPLMQLMLFGFAINNDPKHLPTAVSISDPGVFSGIADEVDVFALGVGRPRRRQIDGLRPQQRGLQQFRITKIVGKPHAGRWIRLVRDAAPHESSEEPLVDGGAADAKAQFCQRGADAVKFASPSLLRQGADEVLFK